MKLLLILLFFINTLLLAKEAILKLDTKGHTSKIKDILVDRNGNIISASYDKTIRVWDSKSGVEKRKILGKIGSDSGEIFAIALSDDNKYLATAGFLDKNSGIDVGKIRIYNYKTGKLINVLKSHIDAVYDLTFSADGKYLVSCSGNKTIKVWDVSSWNLVDTITNHSNKVYGIGIFQSKGKYFLASVALDGTLSLYNLSKHKVIATHNLGYKLKDLAISKEYIAVSGFSHNITIYDKSLQYIKTIKNESNPGSLKFSADGKYLIVGTIESPYVVNIYNTSNFNLHSSFKKHTNLTRAVNFLDEKTAISGGGNSKEIYLWDIDTASIKTKIVGVGNTVWSVGLSGDRVAWGNKWTGDSHTIGSEFEKSIDFKSFTITNDRHHFQRIPTTYGSYSLSHTKGGAYGFNDSVLDIFDGSKKK